MAAQFPHPNLLPVVLPTAERSAVGDCTLCRETFSGNLRCRSLPCGHSFCEQCIDNRAGKKSLTCPTCQMVHIVDGRNKFPINYELENTLIRCKEAHLVNLNQTLFVCRTCLNQSTASEYISQDQDRGVNPRVKTFISSQRVHSNKLLKKIRVTKSEMSAYQDYLNVEKGKQLMLLQNIQTLSSINEATVILFNDEIRRVNTLTTDANELINMMEKTLQKLEVAISLKSAVSAISDLDHPFSALENWNERCRQELPNVNLIASSKMVVGSITSTLSSVQYEASSPAVTDLPRTSLSILEKVDKILGYTTLTIDKLKTMVRTNRGPLEKGLVFAVQVVGGIVRNAMLSIVNDKVFLHYLKLGQPPKECYKVKHGELITCLNEQSVVAFLDLAWEGSTRGRIMIRLSPATPRGNQFRVLCTGSSGACYAHSRFGQVTNIGTVDEHITAGDYDGQGGLSIGGKIDVDLPAYNRSHYAGLVWAHYELDVIDRSAQFSITSGTGNPDVDCTGVFGKVTEGLDIVRKAAKVMDIRNVQIVDCGVVIPL